jgi:hypothetical protein
MRPERAPRLPGGSGVKKLKGKGESRDEGRALSVEGQKEKATKVKN